ncbi:uncharacterized protein LOC127258674 isoform X2 [Andrographis paniculata]|uniref:uncharacterized protein LOC127258674 isoform X2 n=1 Tax=Andrographis paniculata TaxID=175694 RepID=UPI0021E7B9AC|nr:uncharacterized protein LOC127258674 isoform X2 [Andrographis paniculata]
MEEIFDLYKLQYSDLMALLSGQPPESTEETERLRLISDSVMQNLGRSGAGLLSVGGVPKAEALRRALLPTARKLALLNNDDRKRILKEHNLGSDVPLKNPERTVSSFAKQMKYNGDGDEIDFRNERREIGDGGGDFDHLGSTFGELGFRMMELGIYLARACDKLIGGCDLEQSLLQSGTAKGRLIHYHSVADNKLITQGASRSRIRHGRTCKTNVKEEEEEDSELELWQQWHYDYGIFTILTSPMFMVSNGINAEESESPLGHMHLRVYHPTTNRLLMARASEGSFIVQVGESAEVLSKGRLRATLHSVCRLAKMDNLSRETFVVFLQPSWSKKFSVLDYPFDDCDSDEGILSVGSNRSSSLTINEIVPPLRSRLKDGMTFAEFSRQTTKQYYGCKGMQPNKG